MFPVAHVNQKYRYTKGVFRMNIRQLEACYEMLSKENRIMQDIAQAMTFIQSTKPALFTYATGFSALHATNAHDENPSFNQEILRRVMNLTHKPVTLEDMKTFAKLVQTAMATEGLIFNNAITHVLHTILPEITTQIQDILYVIADTNRGEYLRVGLDEISFASPKLRPYYNPQQNGVANAVA